MDCLKLAFDIVQALCSDHDDPKATQLGASPFYDGIPVADDGTAGAFGCHCQGDGDRPHDAGCLGKAETISKAQAQAPIVEEDQRLKRGSAVRDPKKKTPL